MPLNQDEQRIRLEAVADHDWKKAAAQRIAKLPKDQRSIAEGLLGRSETELGALIDALKPAQRRRLFHALHPELAPELEHWWVGAGSRPYQGHWLRRAFRAPHNPELTQSSRRWALWRILDATGPYGHDLAWMVNWGDQILTPSTTGATDLLSCAIDHSDLGDTIFETLVATVRGEHPTAVMHRAAIGALLQASRPEGWDLIEGLLVGAQRQEGLRQSILEQLDEGHRDAFRRLVRTALDHNMFRFASAVRAIGVWFGLPQDIDQPEASRALAERVADMLDDPTTVDAELDSGEPNRIFSALVVLGMDDASSACKRAAALAPNLDSAGRVAVIRFLHAIALPEARSVVVDMLDDHDLEVALHAFRSVLTRVKRHPDFGPDQQGIEAGDPLMRLVERMPATITLAPSVFDPEPAGATRLEVIRAAISNELDSLDPFVRYFDEFDNDTRQAFSLQAGLIESISPAVRACLLKIVAGRGSNDNAVAALIKSGIEPDDAPALEALLTRKATKPRQGVVSLLSSLGEDERLASAERLWVTGNTQQRDAACELIAGVPTDAARSRRTEWATDATERQRELMGEEETEPTASDLYDEADLTPRQHPSGIKKPKPIATQAALKLLDALDDIAEEYKDVEVDIVGWNGTERTMLPDVRWFPDPPTPNRLSRHQGPVPVMVLDDIVRPWWEKRAKGFRDSDGTEAIRAQIVLVPQLSPRSELPDDVLALVGSAAPTIRHPKVVAHWLEWLGAESMTAALMDQLVTASEYLAQELTADQLALVPSVSENRWDRIHTLDPRRRLYNPPWAGFIDLSTFDRENFAEESHRDQLVSRLFRLERWIERPFPDARVPAYGSNRWTLPAFECGQASEADVVDYLTTSPGSHSDLPGLTNRHRTQTREQYPKTALVADRLRTAIVDAELARGALPTETSGIVSQISSIEGADLAMQLVSRLGTLSLARGYTWGDDKKGTLSHLIRVNYPAADDSAETLNAAVERHGVKQQRLIEFGVYAPQWAPIVEEALGWSGFEEAVWWIHAHTKDDGWTVRIELRKAWAAMSAERTPLTSDDLLEGAVDIDWFWRVLGELGKKRWRQVYEAGKYAASGSGHRRAQLFADVLTGASKETALIKQIVDKRHQDSVRGLGLLPLPKAEVGAKKARLKRYRVLREFERGTRAFGSQRQESERMAMRIGLENLARNAGYRDPSHFSWAMEAEELSDLADGPLIAKHDDVTVTLSIDEQGVAGISVDRAGKPLKQIPAKLRKLDKFAELRERKSQLSKQVSRVRSSLEAAMVHRDSFSLAEFAELQRHPVVAPMLRNLVFVDRAGTCLRLDDSSDTGFRSVANRKAKPSSKGDGEIRIAHPVDLLATKKWSEWQAWCFVEGIGQPFKQVFRELYVPTKTELSGKPQSERYAGHQVQTSQARALFTARAWHTHYETDLVTKTFHSEGLVARVSFDEGFLTVADVELPVLHSVQFISRVDAKVQPISAVPASLFSEVMRDLDLVVSVAHAGGVDPEASQSTVEMRTALVRETIAVMSLENVTIVGSHVVIDGKLGEYSLHLGSGVVHRRPGGHVFVIPVHAQRQGRLFLPFADDDPRTAEVLSKLLLFARDDQIQDPTILQQLRG